jgi:hypothetical protein
VYSRVQMMLFKARMAAKAELDQRLTDAGVTVDEVRAYLKQKTWRGSSLFYPRHKKSASMAASVVEHVADDLKKMRSKLNVKATVRSVGNEPLRAAAAPAR